MQGERNATHALPRPDAASLAHSARVAAFIRQKIADAGGSIGFAEFMQLALYAPALGYYSAGATKFGETGDFVTAPEISPVFGRVLARQCAGVLRQCPQAQILELGAGSGALSVQILGKLAEIGAEPARYAIVEVSPDLRQRQEQALRDALPRLRTTIEWLTGMPARFDGVVIANEVADALPVERFRKAGGGVRQLRVKTEAEGFAWCSGPAPDFLDTSVRRIEASLGHTLPDGFESEVSTGLPGWIGDLAGRIGRGFVFLFDYGLPRREYYAPDRSRGWLRCHFRHRAHDDPLIWPGIQDIGAWVDFTAIAEAASAAGMDVAGFVTQAHFLLDGGLDEELCEFSRMPTPAQIELSREIKILTMPGEMGEYFKCIGLSRGVASPAAFSGADRSHNL